VQFFDRPGGRWVPWEAGNPIARKKSKADVENLLR